MQFNYVYFVGLCVKGAHANCLTIGINEQFNQIFSTESRSLILYAIIMVLHLRNVFAFAFMRVGLPNKIRTIKRIGRKLLFITSVE